MLAAYRWVPPTWDALAFSVQTEANVLPGHVSRPAALQALLIQQHGCHDDVRTSLLWDLAPVGCHGDTGVGPVHHVPSYARLNHVDGRGANPRMCLHVVQK